MGILNVHADAVFGPVFGPGFHQSLLSCSALTDGEGARISPSQVGRF